MYFHTVGYKQDSNSNVSSWAHPVTALVTWQGADRQHKVRPSTAALHQTHQSEPSDENQPFWTSQPSKAFRAKILPVDKDISLMLWDMQTAWTSRGLASSGEQINHQNILQRHCYQGSWVGQCFWRQNTLWHGQSYNLFFLQMYFQLINSGINPAYYFLRKNRTKKNILGEKLCKNFRNAAFSFCPGNSPPCH